MKDTTDDHRKEVALFRYGLISEALHLPPDEAARHLKRHSERDLAIPGSARRRVAVTTMQAWVRAYRKSGFDGLAFWISRSWLDELTRAYPILGMGICHIRVARALML